MVIMLKNICKCNGCINFIVSGIQILFFDVDEDEEDELYVVLVCYRGFIGLGVIGIVDDDDELEFFIMLYEDGKIFDEQLKDEDDRKVFVRMFFFFCLILGVIL